MQIIKKIAIGTIRRFLGSHIGITEHLHPIVEWRIDNNPEWGFFTAVPDQMEH